MTYNQLNAHNRDLLIEFDEERHEYFHGGQRLKSVTTLVEECFPKFDAEYWSRRKAPSMGMTPEQLRQKWEDDARRSRDLGTEMHAKIEDYYLGHDAGDDGDAYRLFRMFAAENHLCPYRTEWRIFHEDYAIAGTLDFLERTPDGTFNIYDWKRSKKLVDARGNIEKENRWHSTALPPVAHLSDTSFYHYALQLSMYRFILSRKYGINVSRMRLGVFHPSYSTYYVVDVPYLYNEVEAILNLHLINHKNSLTKHHILC